MANVHVITGGSGGIGLEVAKQFPEDIILISDINEEGLKQGKKELETMGISVETAMCDICSREHIVELLKKAASLGTITNVIHAAGISPNIPDIRLIFNVDLIGSAILLEELVPYLNENMNVICIASMMGYTVTDQSNNKLLANCLDEGALDKIIKLANDDPSIAYNIAKRGVQLLCEKWAPAYGKKGARINSISPGIIETNMVIESNKNFPDQMQQMLTMTPLGRNGQPAEIALPIKFLCSPDATFITGTDLLIDGGLIKNMLSLKQQ
ncbi:MAG TPA: SDR family oxidoreductase [Syntrophomonadaceae bacterium]|nr:SDR family oxidoreductase [Syntrophomonadaceae bacterium]